MSEALTPREEAFRRRMVRRRKLFLIFSATGVLVGLGVLAHGLITGNLTASRFVIVTLVLLLARSQLRQYRTGSVLAKMGEPSPGPLSDGR